MDPNASPGIKIVQIFLERVTFSHREDFLNYPPTSPITANCEISLSAGLTEDRARGRVQVRVRSKESDTSLYQFDLLMTALVEREGSGNLPLERYLGVNGGSTLFPFVREALASITGRGRFGPLWISPVNLVAMVDEAALGVKEPLPPPKPRRAIPKPGASSPGKGGRR